MNSTVNNTAPSESADDGNFMEGYSKSDLLANQGFSLPEQEPLLCSRCHGSGHHTEAFIHKEQYIGTFNNCTACGGSGLIPRQDSKPYEVPNV